MIALQAIEKRFGDTPILRGIDLTVPEGKVTALIGPSGSGKSTLLRCVNLLEIPQAGTLVLGDRRLTFRAGTAPSGGTCWRSGARPAWCSRTSNCFPTAR